MGDGKAAGSMHAEVIYLEEEDSPRSKHKDSHKRWEGLRFSQVLDFGSDKVYQRATVALE